jgi:hypothetical protein
MAEYYAEDITGLPLSVLWDITKKNPFGFAVVAGQKLLGIRFKAAFGVPFPSEPPIQLWEQLPAEMQEHHADSVDLAKDLGLELCFCVTPDYIGNKEAATVVFISADRTVWCTSTWFKISIGGVQRSQMVVSFHSKFSDGFRLHAGIGKASRLDKLLILPNERMEYMPPLTSLQELIQCHEENVSEYPANVVAMTQETLLAEMHEATREAQEQMIKIGLYRRLSAKEVERLTKKR